MARKGTTVAEWEAVETISYDGKPQTNRTRVALRDDGVVLKEFAVKHSADPYSSNWHSFGWKRWYQVKNADCVASVEHMLGHYSAPFVRRRN